MRAPDCSGWHVPVHVQLPNCACIGVKAAASRRRQRPATARHPRTFAARCARASAASLARRPHRDYSSPLWVTFGDGRYLPWPPTVRWHRMVGEGVRVLTVYGCLLITDKAVGHPRQRPRGPGINIEGANVAKEAAKKGSRLLSWQALAVAAVGAVATMGAALIARTSDAPESPALSKVDSSDVAITSVTFETTPKGLKILVRGTASAGLSGDRWIFAIARPKGAASPDGAPRTLFPSDGAPQVYPDGVHGSRWFTSAPAVVGRDGTWTAVIVMPHLGKPLIVSATVVSPGVCGDGEFCADHGQPSSVDVDGSTEITVVPPSTTVVSPLDQRPRARL